MAYSTFDRQCMTRALALAAKALCTTSPNPAVGCVIAREERVTAEGFTRPAGGNHAEIAKWRTQQAQKRAKDNF